MIPKDLQQTPEERKKRPATQKLYESSKVKVIGSLPERYFHCSCCNAIIERSPAQLSKAPDGYEDLCSWCVYNAFGWIVKEG
jgi:hypothetical protein